MLRGLLKKEGNASTHSLNALTEPQNLEAAMRAATHIMNDDLESAEDGLRDGTSTFHKTAKGMVSFLRATLGFEQDVMKEASERLNDAETSATADQRQAQRDVHAFHSAIYPPGAEFALCQAESQLMGAVVGVLNESLTESIRGFYKLRKAFATLDSILAAEAKYMERENGGSVERLSLQPEGSRPVSSSASFGFKNDQVNTELKATDHSPSLAHKVSPSQTSQNQPTNDEDDDEDDFFDAVEDTDDKEVAPAYNGTVEINGIQTNLAKVSMESGSRPGSRDLAEPLQPPPRHKSIDHSPSSEIFKNPIDVFTHTGANLCFGLLNIMLSMIPPAFSKLLYIIGFHGDKDRGIRMLWQASQFHDVNGAFAGLIILGYYNTLVGFSDIIPDKASGSASEDGLEGYPKERCDDLLADMRARHPKSHLWLLEEARGHAANRDVDRAIDLLSASPRSTFKQVAALETFETSLNAMYSHKFELCSKSFIECISLNNWSHALYYYIAGAAEVELYRQSKLTDPNAAAVYAKKAIEHLKQAPLHVGKRKFMARQLPFDVFVARKLKKWEARSHEFGVPLIDAIGVSPVEEMIYFWNGYKRMSPEHLAQSLQTLSSWSQDAKLNPHWKREHADERAILAVLTATTLRNLHRLDEADRILHTSVLDVDHRTELKGGLRDDWTAPAAHYDMGVVCWMRRAQAVEAGSGLEVEQRWVRECESWVEKAAKWESYELDARIGLKVATAQDTLGKWKERRGRAGSKG